jgi:hypothetical protein
MTGSPDERDFIHPEKKRKKKEEDKKHNSLHIASAIGMMDL